MMMAEDHAMYLAGARDDVMFVDQSAGNGQDAFFDSVVEHLQEISMNPAFQELRDGFMEKHADVFEDTEENKLQYMGIFKDWTATIESYITRSLTAAIPGFEMNNFLRTLADRQDQIDSDLFDMLASLGDFQAFKEEMLSFKRGQSMGFTGFDDAGFVVHSLGASS